MLLVSCGDSFVYGSDLADAEHFLNKPSRYTEDFARDSAYHAASNSTWPALIAQRLGIGYDCFAQPGVGNQSIFKQIIAAYTRYKNHAIYSINWTWSDRYDYFDENRNEWATVRPTGAEEEDVDRAYYRYFHNDLHNKFSTLSYIDHAIKFLKENQCQFVMTFMDPVMMNRKHHAPDYVQTLQDSVRSFLHTFDGKNFLEWSKDNQHPISANWHPLESAHKHAAEYLWPEYEKAATTKAKIEKFYCPLPFKHVFVESRGVKPCCSFTQTHAGTVQSWLNSNELKIVQADTLAGVVPVGCQHCQQQEKSQGVGTRITALEQYGRQRFETTQIDYVDYRASNVCNYKCRSCDPFFSHSIAAEVKNSEYLSKLYIRPNEKVVYAGDENAQWVIDNLKNIRRLMFTGGEPTLIPEVRKIIDRVVESNRQDIEIIITTNGSFEDAYWYDLIQTQPNINFTVSLDAVGSAAEIIRHGTRWERMQRNIRFLAEHASSTNFSTVVSRLNVFQLGPLLDFTHHIRDTYKKENGRTQIWQIVNWPQYLNPYNWPPRQQAMAIDYLTGLLEKDLYDYDRSFIESLIDGIKNTPFDQELWDQGEKYNAELNRLREQDHTVLYHPT